MSNTPRKWIFLRGLARHSLHWGPFVGTFKEFFPGEQVEMLDARGNGNQSHIPSYWTIADNVRDLRARSQLLQKGPVHMLSISLGSMMAIKWAELFPQDVLSLTCINTSDGKNSQFYDRLRLSNLPSILGALLNYSEPLSVERRIMHMVAPHLANSEAWIQKFATVLPTSRENVIRQLVAASRFRLPPEKPACPVLLMAAKGDGFVNPECSARIARAWGLDVHWHTQAGHELPLEEPRWVCEQLQKFISGVHPLRAHHIESHV